MTPVASQQNMLAANAQDQVLQVGLGEVVPSPLQPRRQFTEEQLAELVESIREHGIIQPLIVREVDGKYELIAGERRWRAAGKLGKENVPIIVREASDRDVLEMALIENLQRENLTPIEEAFGYVRLRKEFKMKQEEISRRVGKSRAAVANIMRLLELSEPCQEMLVSGGISMGHAKVLLSLKDQEVQTRVAQDIERRSLTVRQTEKIVHNILNPKEEAHAKKTVSPVLEPYCHRLTKQFGTPVTISAKGAHGTIEISYSNRSELVRLLEIFGMDASEL
ncbi:ParB/RepB/Spo0J family partition protein [Akkermansia glycaniphila]|uniref:ParB/RepB/Spo0J family partition protein n=1 Tax=Akkermansia glycaniphila TaxID=1679444 RepID=UPI001C016B18|nr:ParB/RepB/Spo0J family partition protein [Akkermansia glycaniphila]